MTVWANNLRWSYFDLMRCLKRDTAYLSLRPRSMYSLAFCGVERISISLCRLAGSFGWLRLCNWRIHFRVTTSLLSVVGCMSCLNMYFEKLISVSVLLFSLSGCLFNESNFHHFSDFKEVGESLFWKRYLFLWNFAGLFAPWRPFRR